MYLQILPFFNYFCKFIFAYSKFITNTMFCAGTFTTGEGACDVSYLHNYKDKILNYIFFLLMNGVS